MEGQEQVFDSPRVIAPPPLIYTGGLVLGLLLRYLKPLELFSNNPLFYWGVGLIVLSIILFVSAIRFFAKTHTSVDPRKPTTFIIINGPYRFSRNPIYLSMTILYLGIALWLNDLWLFLVLVPVLLTIQYGVINREEIYLTRKFGETYTRYKESTRCWL